MAWRPHGRFGPAHSLTTPDEDAALIDGCNEYYADPLGFVLWAYPWGVANTALAPYHGPDTWQCEFLEWLGAEVRMRAFDGVHPVKPIRAGVSSGHGIGKGVMAAWLVNWIMSTRRNCRGTVTANTMTQLQTKTWATIDKWSKLCVTAPWFIINTQQMYHRDHRKNWFTALQNSKKENAEAFAGQHAADSTSLYVFDESSAIHKDIWDMADGGLTDGEPMFFAFGNPTRNTGEFHRVIFGSGRDKWHGVVVDGRVSQFTNKVEIAEWEAEHGEESDYFRVKVRGVPPRGSDSQFIDLDRIWQAQRNPATSFDADPLIVGVDVSDGGSNWNVIRFRRGLDARSIPAISKPGQFVRGDRGPFLAILAEVLNSTYVCNGKPVKVAHMFIDSAFGSPFYERLKAMGHENVSEVRFGGESPEVASDGKPRFGNMRAYMWGKCKEWLPNGAIQPADDLTGRRLETDLSAPGFHLDKRDRILLESKEDMKKNGFDSPDHADALVLTFAAPIVVLQASGPPQRAPGPRPPRGSGWMRR